MNADVVYPKGLLNKLIDTKHETALAVDIKPCGREEVKVIDGGSDKIVAIGKELIETQCLGEFIGVAKLSKDFSLVLLTFVSILGFILLSLKLFSSLVLFSKFILFPSMSFADKL